MLLPLSWSRVDAMAPVSWGAMMMALAPWLTSAWVLATSLAMSFCELVGGIRSTPCSVASCGTYLLYEFQKSESARGKSTPTLPPAAAAAGAEEAPSPAVVGAGSEDPQAASASASRVTLAATDRFLMPICLSGNGG